MVFIFCVSILSPLVSLSFLFFFNDTATTEIYTLSLHDALPINRRVSASWPGVRRVTRLRPRPSQMVWSLVVSPPVTVPAPAGGLPGSAGAPVTGAGGVLVGADDAGVNLGVPVQLPSPIGLGPQGGLDAGPGAVGLPAHEPLVDRLPRPRPLGQIPPRDPGAGPEHDAVEDRAVIPPTPTPLGRHRWQQGASRSHSSSVSSNRRFTPGFYRITYATPNRPTDPRNRP